MLARYQIVRGRRRPDDPLPDGLRIDVRKHTSHVLAPERGMVATYLEDPDDPKRFDRFRRAYLALLKRRYNEDRSPFDELAEQAERSDVYLGCSCPTKQQPDVRHCHTVLALGFMRERYPSLEIVEP